MIKQIRKINYTYRRWKNSSKLKGCYFFMHIPKTGGTTFRHLLYDNFDSKHIYPTTEHLKENGGGYLPQKSITSLLPTFPMNYIIIGHYNYAFSNRLPSNTRTIVFLRDPIQRTKSHIKHIKLHDPKSNNVTISKVLNFKIKTLSNHQAKLFGYNPKLNNLDHAINNLEKCAFIGISESFQKSIDKLNKTLNWNLSYSENDNRNQTPNTSDYSFSPDENELIEAHTREDLILYNHALSLFNS